MRFKNTAQGYGLLAKSLHWAVALLMIFLLWLGWYMVRLDYYHPWYYSSFHLHQWAGILVWLLGLLLLFWRLINPIPPLPLKPVERVVSKGVHWLLIVAVLFLPLAGIVVVLSDGNPLMLGDYELPITMQVSDRLRHWAVTSHYYVAYSTGCLVVLHATAALKHHVINRDNTLKRML